MIEFVSTSAGNPALFCCVDGTPDVCQDGVVSTCVASRRFFPLRFLNDPTTDADDRALVISARSGGYVLPCLLAFGMTCGVVMAIYGEDEIQIIGAGVVGTGVSGLVGVMTGGHTESRTRTSIVPEGDDRPLLDLPQPLILAETKAQVELPEDEYELIPVAEPVSSPPEFSEGFAYVPPKENKMGFSINRLVSIEEIRQNMAIANQKQDRN